MSGAVEAEAGEVGALPERPLKQLRRRRPSGAPPPLPHHLQTTGLGWLIGVLAVGAATIVVFGRGVSGPAITASRVDHAIVRWLSGIEAPGLHAAARAMSHASSWWTIQFLVVGVELALLACRRWRHLLVTLVVIQLALGTADLVEGCPPGRGRSVCGWTPAGAGGRSRRRRCWP